MKQSQNPGRPLDKMSVHLKSAATSVMSTNLTCDSRSTLNDVESYIKEEMKVHVIEVEEERTDSHMVDWEENDPENPRNWSQPRKWIITIVVALFAFIPPLSSSIIAPALPVVGKDLHIPSEAEVQLVLSVYLLALAFSPLIFAPCSEIWGRKRILQYGNLAFVLFNLSCGFAPNEAAMIVLRLFTGIAGSASSGVGSGVLHDVWHPEERGKGSSIYQLAHILGPCVGPIVGGLITQYTTWRWTFWSLSCFSMLIQLIGLFCLKETYPPFLLGCRAKILRKETGNEQLRTSWESEDRTMSKLLKKSLIRPWKLLGTQPIIQLIAVYMAFNYGMLYLFIASFAELWTKEYGMTPFRSSLNYIFLALGSLIGAQLGGPIIDWAYRRLKARNNGHVTPEFRILVMIPAAALEPLGILLYGWSAHYHAHWLLPNLGVVIVNACTMVLYQGLQLYITDSYGSYTSSASAAIMVLRSLAAFSFPIFCVYLYKALGYGLAGTVLAAVAFVIGVPAPILLWKFGARLRAMSPYAATGGSDK